MIRRLGPDPSVQPMGRRLALLQSWRAASPERPRQQPPLQSQSPRDKRVRVLRPVRRASQLKDKEPETAIVDSNASCPQGNDSTVRGDVDMDAVAAATAQAAESPTSGWCASRQRRPTGARHRGK